METDFLIRPEAASDREEVEELLLAAFPTSLELRLVRQLREDADVVFSLVAVEAAAMIEAGPALMGLALADGGLDGPRIEYASAFSSIPD